MFVNTEFTEMQEKRPPDGFFFPDYRCYTRAVPGASAMWWTLKSSLQESHIRTTSSLSTDTASPLSTSTRAASGRLRQVPEVFLDQKVTGRTTV